MHKKKKKAVNNNFFKKILKNQKLLNQSVGNVGLSASAESVQQLKRSSRRGSSRHPHRSSSRRNKENGGSRPGSFRNTNINSKDDGRIRKQRAVSFEQQQLPHQQIQHTKWCLDKTDNVDEQFDDDFNMMMDTSPLIVEHHFKPPRV